MYVFLGKTFLDPFLDIITYSSAVENILAKGLDTTCPLSYGVRAWKGVSRKKTL
jgi:hypothetical protein